MKAGTNLHTSTINRLRENTAGPGGWHHFDLSSSNAGSKELTVISDSIKHNNQSCEGMAPLISIDLSGNQICGIDFMMTGTYDSDGLNELSNVLINMSKMSRLRKLNLSRNFLDVKGFTILSNLLAKGPESMQDLNLRSCGGDGHSIEKFAEGLKKNTTLLILDLRQNHFGPFGAGILGDVIASNFRLRQLNISECEIGSDGAAEICRGLSNNQTLEVLSMGDNNIGDTGAEHVANMLRVNRKLKHLDLQENRIGMEGVSGLAKALTKNQTLSFLGLQWNDVSNEGAAKLAEGLMYNNTLRSLHIVGNHIDGDGISLLIESSLTSNDKPIDLDLSFSHQTTNQGKK
jgi:hypothetical protein